MSSSAKSVFLSRGAARSTRVADEALSTERGTTESGCSTGETDGARGIHPLIELRTLEATLAPLAQMGSSGARGEGVGVGRVGLRRVAGATPWVDCLQTRSEAAEVEARRRDGREKVFGERGERGERARGVVVEAVVEVRTAGEGGVEGEAAAAAMEVKEVVREGAPEETSAAQSRIVCDFVRGIVAVEVEATGSSSSAVSSDSRTSFSADEEATDRSRRSQEGQKAERVS
jgi:hypothetical protein